MLIGNSIGILESTTRLSELFQWAYSQLSYGGSILISMTFPENGPIPLGIEQPRRKYQYNESFFYERSFRFDVDTKFTILSLSYWIDDELVHQDKLNLTRFEWTEVIDLGSKYFGKDNIKYELKINEAQNIRNSPYEVFFQLTKI